MFNLNNSAKMNRYRNFGTKSIKVWSSLSRDLLKSKIAMILRTNNSRVKRDIITSSKNSNKSPNFSCIFWGSNSFLYFSFKLKPLPFLTWIKRWDFNPTFLYYFTSILISFSDVAFGIVNFKTPSWYSAFASSTFTSAGRGITLSNLP